MRLTHRHVGGALAAAGLGLLLLQPPAHAIPAFARKYQVNCYLCHTIFPRLNKMGYLFKRNGYRLPPKPVEGKPAPRVREVDAALPWRPRTAMALYGVAEYESIASGAPGAASSESVTDLDTLAFLSAGPIPGTGFSYLAKYVFYYEGGEREVGAADLTYTWGRADRSFFVKAGKMYLLQGEGFRGSDPRGVFPWAPLALSASDPAAFSLDQNPVGLAGGATWTTPGYRGVFGLSGKVTLGLDEKGEPVNRPGGTGHRDLFLEADYLFGNDNGVSAFYYRGRKPVLAGEDSPAPFRYDSTEERWGLFANRLIFSQLDLSAGYVGGRAGWRASAADPVGHYTTRSLFGEASYYPEAWRGLVLSARVEGLRERCDGWPGTVETRAWSVSAQRALLRFGDLAVRASYRDAHRDDPASGVTVERRFRLDLRVAW